MKQVTWASVGLLDTRYLKLDATNSMLATTLITNLNADLLDSAHVGTSGAAIGLLNTGNTWSALQTHTLATEQLRLGYDTDSYCSFTVGAASGLTIKPAESGTITLQPTTDSVTFLQVLDADGGVPILNVDTTNERVGIGTAAPVCWLDITTGDTTSSGFHFGEVINEGGYLSSIDDNYLLISGGAELTSGSIRARSTKASHILLNDGFISFYANTSLTDGNTYTATERVKVGQTTATSLTVYGESSSAGSGPLVLTYSGTLNFGVGFVLDASTGASGTSYGFYSTGSAATGGANDFAVIDITDQRYVFRVGTTGGCIVGANQYTELGQLSVYAYAAATKGLVVQGAASQSGNLQEWQNSASTILSYVDAVGNVGVRMGATAATSYLHLAAGTATASTAPLKFTPGTLLTAPEVGALESSTSGLFYTTLGDRRSLVQASQPITASTTVANTTNETTIYTTTLAANELIAGETIWTHLFGYLSTHDAADTATIRVKVGATTVLTLATSAGLMTNQPLSIEPVITVRTVGATGTIFAYGLCEMANVGKAVANTATTTVDTTAVSSIAVTVQWDSADASNSVTIAQGWSKIVW